MKSQLSPEAPVYIPPPLRNVTNLTPAHKTISPSGKSPCIKEPQCSRYSRKSVRQICTSFQSPRPILGSQSSLPRPILGRKSDEVEDEIDEHIGKEFRSISRIISKLKINDDEIPDENLEDGC